MFYRKEKPLFHSDYYCKLSFETEQRKRQYRVQLQAHSRSKMSACYFKAQPRVLLGTWTKQVLPVCDNEGLHQGQGLDRRYWGGDSNVVNVHVCVYVGRGFNTSKMHIDTN